ncbi:type II toxin-antitoxin system HicA family toxin [Candidatus Bathyarchaeota archaeon]|nr:type II toxin-antitoxin system HicA family toxin [Candidatus Bathyarchaeota archaeon]
MPRLRPIRGSQLIKILCNHFGFSKVRQRGSHATLCRDKTYITVPVGVIQIGLLNRILRDCEIPREELIKHY